MDCLKVTQPDKVKNIIQDDQKPVNKWSSKLDEETHETDNGKLKVTQYGIKMKKQKRLEDTMLFTWESVSFGNRAQSEHEDWPSWYQVLMKILP